MFSTPPSPATPRHAFQAWSSSARSIKVRSPSTHPHDLVSDQFSCTVHSHRAGSPFRTSNRGAGLYLRGPVELSRVYRPRGLAVQCRGYGQGECMENRQGMSLSEFGDRFFVSFSPSYISLSFSSHSAHCVVLYLYPARARWIGAD